MINSVVRLVMICMFSLLTMLNIHGCSSTPIRPSKAQSVVFQKPVDVTRNAAVKALQSMGLTIYKGNNSGAVYVEGKGRFPVNESIVIGNCRIDTFERVEERKIWLESLGGGKTKVYVNDFTDNTNAVLLKMGSILGESQ